MLFRQLFDQESSTYTYLIADPKSKTAVLVDPVLEQMERDLQLLTELELTLLYCLETHRRKLLRQGEQGTQEGGENTSPAHSLV